MPEPKRILYLMDRYEHPYGGTERQVMELIRRIDRHRFSPHIAVFRDSEYLKDHNFDCPVDVLGIYKMMSIESTWKLYKYMRTMKSNSFNLAHIFFNDASILGPPITKLAGMGVVVSRRDMGFWYTARNTRILRLNRLFVDHVVSNSQAVKTSVQQVERFMESEISVIFNGYNNELEEVGTQQNIRDMLGIGPNGKIIGIVANLRTIKRIEDLLKAFSLVRRSHGDAWLIMVGTGPLLGELENLAQSLNIGDQCIFLGQVANVIPIVREFTVGVLCSESEGFSNSIIEYMKCGKPTVCTDVGGNPEIVRNGHNGFLIGVGDIEGLAERISSLLSDPDLVRELGDNALVDVREKYSMDAMVESHMALYDEIIDRHRLNRQ